MKIGNFSAGFFDEQDARGGIPTIEAKLPKAVEATDSHGGEIERGGTVTPNAVRTKREIIIVMNVGARLAFVNGKTGAKQAGGERRNFGDGDFVAVEGSAFAAGGSEEFFVNRIVNDAGDDFVAMSEGDRDAETGIAVGEVGGAVERVDVPAVLGVAILAETFFRSDGVGGEIF